MNDKQTYGGLVNSLGDLSINCQSFIVNAWEFKKSNPIEFHRLFFEESKNIISLPVRNKMGWWVLNSNKSMFNIPKFELFYFLFYHHKFTSSSLELVKSHFIGDESPEGMIVLECDIQTFVLLFETLIYKVGVIPILPKESFYDILISHFLIRNEKTQKVEKLKRRSLISSLSASKANDAILKTVDKFILFLIN